MIAHRNLGLVAAAATLLAAAPLSAIFDRWTWLIQSTIAVAVVAAVAALTRLGRVPLWGQVLAMLGGLTLALAWLFPSGSELFGVVPTPGTFGHFGALAEASMDDMRSYGVKVPDTDPLLFISVLGVGGVAVMVDLVAVGLRRPALAGLPMLAVYSVPVAVYVDSVPPVPFVIGAAGYLWLLVSDNVDRVRRFGRRFTGDGRGVDVWEASPLASAGRRLAALGVAVAVMLPLAVPGMTGGLLDSLGSGTGDGTGGPGRGGAPGRIDLFAALRGELNQSEVTDLVKVTTNEPSPFYLRFGVADQLRSDGFHERPPTGRPISRQFGPSEPDRAGIDRNRYRASVEVTKNLQMPFLPVYSEPTQIDGLNGNWYYDTSLQVVFSNRDNSPGKRYEFDYVRSTYTPAALRRARPLPADHSLRRQMITPQVPEVEKLVGTLIEGKRTEYDKVRAIYDYFSSDNGFTYALSTEGGTSGQDIVDFLNNKVGFCQQYAAAMAWLVRAAGVPARVAFGFTNGTNTGDGTYTLTNRNLHAWTEVYFDGFGWVPFDATPMYGVQGGARSAWAPDVDAPEESSPQPGATTGPDEPESTSGPDRREEGEEGAASGLPDDGGASSRPVPVWLWWVAGAVALLVLLAVPALRRLALRRRRSGGRAPAPVPAEAVAADAGGAPADGQRMVVLADADRARADAHAAWDELLDTLVDFRVRIDRTETPRATADRLARETLREDTEAMSAVQLLGRAEERARYARDPLTGEPLLPALRRVRVALAAGADRRTRLFATALPPSVLLRWRVGAVDVSARLVSGYGRIRYAAARWSPRRLLANRLAR
ncbi:transglutaminaseTgpA domain-containing protein [Micromonospora sp. NPDC126480]|uniref:transglutaminaseTgpA domain-containing protein n=1 Tax=Micromonospora sp. NPDC126480 TaxID=3155312 RepID=UPI0033322DAC